MNDRKDMRGACHKCIYKGIVPGNTHISCEHPDSGRTKAEEGIDGLLAILGGGLPSGTPRKLGIKADIRGVQNGWFAWPLNFDPSWLLHCDGFKEREKNETSA